MQATGWMDLTVETCVYRYTGEFSLNIPADAGFGNNFNLVTFPDHAPQTQQVLYHTTSVLLGLLTMFVTITG